MTETEGMAEGSEAIAEVLGNDPASGVIRHLHTRYTGVEEIAIAKSVNIPMSKWR
jgi:urocanate hydratase